MKILLVRTSAQSGYEPLSAQLARELKQIQYMAAEVTEIEAAAGVTDALNYQYDCIILLDSLKFYLDNRLSVKGRPWVCLASFCFEPMVSLLTTPINETGVHVVFSNCAPFVAQISHVLPTMYFWKPVLPAAPEVHGTRVGCVLPNIADRDFCLLQLAADIFEAEKADTNRLVIYTRCNDTFKLPERLRRYEEEYQADLETNALAEYEIFRKIKHFIPAPRITDYRVGIVPAEIIKAAVYNCEPVLVGHPALKPLEKYITPIFDSLKAYKAKLIEIAKETPSSQISVNIPEGMRPTVGDLARAISLSHQRWKANAS